MEYKILSSPLSYVLEGQMNALADDGWKVLTAFDRDGTMVAVMEKRGAIEIDIL
jgi:hypothetical protein